MRYNMVVTCDPYAVEARLAKFWGKKVGDKKIMETYDTKEEAVKGLWNFIESRDDIITSDVENELLMAMYQEIPTKEFMPVDDLAVRLERIAEIYREYGDKRFINTPNVHEQGAEGDESFNRDVYTFFIEEAEEVIEEVVEEEEEE